MARTKTYFYPINSAAEKPFAQDDIGVSALPPLVTPQTSLLEISIESDTVNELLTSIAVNVLLLSILISGIINLILIIR